MSDIKWILTDELIDQFIIHTTEDSLRRAIGASVYKKKVVTPFVHWYLQDEKKSPVLPHVYIVELMKYHLKVTGLIYHELHPEPGPGPTPPGPTPGPPMRSTIKWDSAHTGGPNCTCEIRNNMAIFDGDIAYYQDFYAGPGNYIGIDIDLNADPTLYPNFKVVMKPSHAFDYDREFGIEIVHFREGEKPDIHWFPKVMEPGEEFRLLILWNGVDGGPKDPYTETVLSSVTEESTLLLG